MSEQSNHENSEPGESDGADPLVKRLKNLHSPSKQKRIFLEESDLMTRFTLDTFDEEWKIAKTNEKLLYNLYCHLRAPQKFIDDCISVLEVHIMHHLSNSHLIVRGSATTGLCLKSWGDIDLDLVFPRSIIPIESFNQKSCDEQEMKGFCVELLNRLQETRHIKTDYSRFNVEMENPEINKTTNAYNSEEKYDINDPSISCSGLLKASFYPLEISLQWGKDNESLTRSLPLTVRFNGYPMEVDLFPKFLNEKGEVCGHGPKKAGKRIWECRDPFPYQDGIELTDNDRAAVLFLKYWKKHLSDNKLKEGLKGFHIAAVLYDEVKKFQSSKRFSKEVVFSRMKQVIDKLIEAYSGGGNFLFGENKDLVTKLNSLKRKIGE